MSPFFIRVELEACGKSWSFLTTVAEEALIETLIGGAGGLEVISYGEELEATSKETRGREVSGGGVVANMATQA